MCPHLWWLAVPWTIPGTSPRIFEWRGRIVGRWPTYPQRPKYPKNWKRHRIWAISFSNLEGTTPPPLTFPPSASRVPSVPPPPPLSTPMDDTVPSHRRHQGRAGWWPHQAHGMELMTSSIYRRLLDERRWYTLLKESPRRLWSGDKIAHEPGIFSPFFFVIVPGRERFAFFSTWRRIDVREGMPSLALLAVMVFELLRMLDRGIFCHPSSQWRNNVQVSIMLIAGYVQHYIMSNETRHTRNVLSSKLMWANASLSSGHVTMSAVTRTHAWPSFDTKGTRTAADCQCQPTVKWWKSCYAEGGQNQLQKE